MKNNVKRSQRYVINLIIFGQPKYIHIVLKERKIIIQSVRRYSNFHLVWILYLSYILGGEYQSSPQNMMVTNIYTDRRMHICILGNKNIKYFCLAHLDRRNTNLKQETTGTYKVSWVWHWDVGIKFLGTSMCMCVRVLESCCENV
jgi:hypothetical protein